MSEVKKGKMVITQEDIDKIITPLVSREETIKLVKRYEEEYEKSKQQILEVMRKNSELYKEEQED